MDAKNLLQHIHEMKSNNTVNEAVNQVAFADLILLNKIDLVSGDQLAAVQAEIKAINGAAKIVCTRLDQIQEDSPDFVKQVRSGKVTLYT